MIRREVFGRHSGFSGAGIMVVGRPRSTLRDINRVHFNDTQSGEMVKRAWCALFFQECL